ncbi:TetR/AcrR family transcriptional regulator [Wukongibacter baidiensis]|uniref:TetR/AcrR family transcriptional regulator n=1 Tax=Wukongibacter baidiensis TaxID=1723361 RepID=UPI003D7F219E
MHNSPQTKQKIIDTAIALFKEYGYEKVSIKQICQQLKFGRSTFYYHFRTKEQILSEFYKPDKVFNTERMSWILTAESNIERAFRIQLAYEKHIDSVGSTEAIIHYLASGMTKGFDENVVSAKEMKVLLMPIIKQCQELGEIKNPTDAETLCNVAINLQNGILMKYCLSKGNLNREEMLISSLKALYCIE